MTEDEYIEVLQLLAVVGSSLTKIVEIVGTAWIRSTKEQFDKEQQ